MALFVLLGTPCGGWHPRTVAISSGLPAPAAVPAVDGSPSAGKPWGLRAAITCMHRGPGSTSAPVGLHRAAAVQPITSTNSYSHAQSCDLFANLPAVGVFSKAWAHGHMTVGDPQPLLLWNNILQYLWLQRNLCRLRMLHFKKMQICFSSLSAFSSWFLAGFSPWFLH